jgi:hemerythrin-like domain-containing protein
MQARAPLMIEHRLIERMIGIIKRILSQIEKEEKVDPVFVDTTVDFIRTYTDRTHHGKEEDILFRELVKRDLSEEDQLLMNDLIEEHMLGRNTTKKLIEANTRYRNGDKSALTEIVSNLRLLVNFYPKHIKKEDKVFFPSARGYFSEQEDQAMLNEFWEFDRKMIHEKYISLIESFENK